MGEGAAAVAVAEGVDVGDVGLAVIVDGDVAAFVDDHAGLVEAEVLRVGGAANGEQDVGADDGCGVELAVGADADAAGVRREVDAFG